LYNQNRHCPVGSIVRKKSGLLYYFDNKTLSKSNFTFILFYKKLFVHFLHRKLKIVPSKFQFFLTIKKGFYRKYAIRWYVFFKTKFTNKQLDEKSDNIVDEKHIAYSYLVLLQ
jgi:hypothetical protein